MDSKQTTVVEAEFNRLANQLEGLANRLFAQSIDLAKFEKASLGLIKATTIRAYYVGANAVPTAKHYGSAGLHLRQQYASFHELTGQIFREELSIAQIKDRLKRQAQSIRVAAARAEKISFVLDGFDLAKRTLDPLARHCRSCIRYATRHYVQIAQIVPRGVNCECAGNCRCMVSYKRSGNAFNRLSLADAINRSDRETAVSENDLLAKIEQLLRGRRRVKPRRKNVGFGLLLK